ISFEATKDSLKRFGEELQTKTPKRLKEDKDDEPTKKSEKRRKQMARKGMHTSVDKNDSEDSDKVGEQEETVHREDGTDIVYINFCAMMKSISRDDLTELYRIVMNRYGMDRPEDKLEKGFWKCLREFCIERNLLAQILYEVHCLNLESMDVYMLSDRKYPLSAELTMDIHLSGGQRTDYSRVNGLTGVKQTGSDENRMKLYDLMYKIVNVADTMD
ncbi:hypothetical protein Tco_0660055, partial [Tanacetum coccineum]